MRALIRRILRAQPPAVAAKGDRIPEDVAEIIRRVQPHTMTGWERIWALVEAVRYVVRRDIPGAFVECGVWRGGSVMAMLLALKELGVGDRDVYLYDTFEGMTAPARSDTSDYTVGSAGPDGAAWRQTFDPRWQSVAAVRANLASIDYAADRLHFVQGRVEDTLPGGAPQAIALLRLDTDWYESTRHELETLYPRLQQGGVLIIDDYGHWQGCKRAVDEYFARPDVESVLLNRIDYTGRLAVKV